MKRLILFLLAITLNLTAGCATYLGYHMTTKEISRQEKPISSQKTAKLTVASVPTRENPSIQYQLSGKEIITQRITRTYSQIRNDKYGRYNFGQDFYLEPFLTAVYGVGPIIILLKSISPDFNKDGNFAENPPSRICFFFQNVLAFVLPFYTVSGAESKFIERKISPPITKSDIETKSKNFSCSNITIRLNIAHAGSREIITDDDGYGAFNLQSDLEKIQPDQPLRITATPLVDTSQIATESLTVAYNAAALKPTPTPTPPPPPPVPPVPDHYLTQPQAQFLISELEKTISYLAQEPMVPPNATAGFLEKGKLISWFDLERPEAQGIYYRVQGRLPIQDKTLLSRTKSEFFQMNKMERENLKNNLQLILMRLKREIEPQSNSDLVGISQDSIP